MYMSWAMDLDPKGVNNQLKESIDKRYVVDSDSTFARELETINTSTLDAIYGNEKAATASQQAAANANAPDTSNANEEDDEEEEDEEPDTSKANNETGNCNLLLNQSKNLCNLTNTSMFNQNNNVSNAQNIHSLSNATAASNNGQMMRGTSFKV
jgi:hypothetical protein